MSARIAEFIWIVAIALGITAIFGIAPFEIALDSVITSLAILALVWIHIARSSLSPGSVLRKFASYIFICLIFMFLSSIWELGSKIFEFDSYFSRYFTALAFIFLVVSCYKLMQIGEAFGFSKKAKGIKEIIAAQQPQQKAKK